MPAAAAFPSHRRLNSHNHFVSFLVLGFDISLAKPSTLLVLTNTVNVDF